MIERSLPQANPISLAAVINMKSSLGRAGHM
jgi:hypothetical protein